MSRRKDQVHDKSVAQSSNSKSRLIFLFLFGTFWIAMGLASMQKVSANPALQFLVGGFCIAAALILMLLRK